MAIRILLIEDDTRLGQQLKPDIEKAGHTVDWAESRQAGLDLFYANKPDVVLLDLMLPDGSGYALLETIRRDFSTPVIVISARSLGEDKVRALDLGADDYITKPFWTNELSARIRAVARRTLTGKSEILEFSFGDVSIDLKARQLYVSKKQKSLTPTEFSLLEFFIRRPNQALRRERIIDSIIRNPDSATEALQTHVSRLRRKLGPDGRRIKTVWGIGYRFDPTDEQPE
jgi:DNA-binding response OmpR family regulator